MLKRMGIISAVSKVSILIGIFIFSSAAVSVKLKNNSCELTLLTDNSRSQETETDWAWEDAKTFVRELGINTKSEFFTFLKSEECPDDFPKKLDRVFREFTTWNDFFGISESEAVKNGQQKPVRNRDVFINQTQQTQSSDENVAEILKEIGLENLDVGVYEK